MHQGWQEGRAHRDQSEGDRQREQEGAGRAFRDEVGLHADRTFWDAIPHGVGISGRARVFPMALSAERRRSGRAHEILGRGSQRLGRWVYLVAERFQGEGAKQRRVPGLTQDDERGAAAPLVLQAHLSCVALDPRPVCEDERPTLQKLDAQALC